MSDAVKALISWCNDQGGINGRQVVGHLLRRQGHRGRQRHDGGVPGRQLLPGRPGLPARLGPGGGPHGLRPAVGARLRHLAGVLQRAPHLPARAGAHRLQPGHPRPLVRRDLPRQGQEGRGHRRQLLGLARHAREAEGHVARGRRRVPRRATSSTTWPARPTGSRSSSTSRTAAPRRSPSSAPPTRRSRTCSRRPTSSTTTPTGSRRATSTRRRSRPGTPTGGPTTCTSGTTTCPSSTPPTPPPPPPT